MLFLVLFKSVELFRNYLLYKKLKKQGVKFLGDGNYAVVRDLKLLLENWKQKPTCLSFMTLFKNEFPEEMPPVVGLLAMGRVQLMVTSVECLQDLYVNKNAQVTKFWAPKA